MIVAGLVTHTHAVMVADLVTETPAAMLTWFGCNDTCCYGDCPGYSYTCFYHDLIRLQSHMLLWRLGWLLSHMLF